ncbi:N-acetylmannosamine kinase [Streptomyces hirsutus]
MAAEFGHIRMVPDGLLCGCGSQGCWEQYASGRALVRYATQRANATPENAETLLALGDGTPEGIEGKHVSMAARQGDPVAVDSYRELARWVGAGLADLASLFDPSAFIVGGGLSDEGELLLDPIRSRTSAGWWAATGARSPTSGPPSSATRPAWWARPTWPGNPIR